MSPTDEERLVSEANLKSPGRELSDAELDSISAAAGDQKGPGPDKKPGKP